MNVEAETIIFLKRESPLKEVKPPDTPPLTPYALFLRYLKMNGKQNAPHVIVSFYFIKWSKQKHQLLLKVIQF